MISFICLVLVAAVCAIKAVRTVHLLHAALWLAGVSAAVTLMLYLIGAYMVAVIELSLSVGLLTILLVFAISMVGADSPDIPASKWINLPLLAAMLLLVIGLSLPLLAAQADAPASEASYAATFWQQREADVLAQIALIFAGVLGVLGLLTESRHALTQTLTQALTGRKPIKAQPQREAAEQAAIPEGERELEKR